MPLDAAPRAASSPPLANTPPMSLLTTYTDANKVVNQELSITYKMEPKQIEGSWVITRQAAKNYEYVGLTKAAAMECAAVKRAQYYSSFLRAAHVYNDRDRITAGYPIRSRMCTRPGADITVQHTDGNAWKVVIAVNQEDQLAFLTKDTDQSRSYSEKDLVFLDPIQLANRYFSYPHQTADDPDSPTAIPYLDPYSALPRRCYDEDDGFKISLVSVERYPSSSSATIRVSFTLDNIPRDLNPESNYSRLVFIPPKSEADMRWYEGYGEEVQESDGLYYVDLSSSNWSGADLTFLGQREYIFGRVVFFRYNNYVTRQNNVIGAVTNTVPLYLPPGSNS